MVAADQPGGVQGERQPAFAALVGELHLEVYRFRARRLGAIAFKDGRRPVLGSILTMGACYRWKALRMLDAAAALPRWVWIPSMSSLVRSNE
jgi:hypothetical protein